MMEALISSANSIEFRIPKFASSIFLFHFPSLSRENRKFLQISGKPSRRLANFPPSTITASAAAAAASSSSSSSSPPSGGYGGWDESRIGGDRVNSGESTQLRDLLVSVGIDDKKHVFTFLLGVACAFAISRVRISSVIVFPASVLVFGIGFLVGFVNGGSFSENSVNASKRSAEEDNIRVYSERLKGLMGFFDKIDVKVDNMKNGVQRAIDTREIGLSDLESYVNVIEAIKASALDTRNAVEGIVDGAGNWNGAMVENLQSSSKKRKELGEVGFELLRFVGGLFGEKLVSSKTNKVKEKDHVKLGPAEGLGNEQSCENGPTPATEDGVLNASNKGNRYSVFAQGLTNILDEERDGRIKILSEDAEVNSRGIGGSARRFIGKEEFFYQNNRSQFVNNHHSYWKMDQNNESEMQQSHGNLHDSVDFSVRLRHTETESSFVREQMFEKSGEVDWSSHTRRINGDETYRSRFREEGMSHDLHSRDHQSIPQSEGSSTSSSMFSDDLAFDRYLTEANNLLKQAKECMRGRRDEEHAEIILYKSANLLSKATAMKPMSLLAVGQLGNTYLLHGELKLKISRDLRTLLSRRDLLSLENRGGILKNLDNQEKNRDKIVSVLVNVCEECEELLVEAGRKYRLALSIDGNDVKTLYNWGLALSFRAQLIADIGPEAAFDADKVFLAAIDKFDAMMSKGNDYAPDALFRWGAVLQQRSRLRPSNSKEKLKLLQQAKRLYEDSLVMDSDNIQVRRALSSCIFELNRRLL